MDKKNTMLLTVIAVATLLVAVVGATFAFFAVQTPEAVNTKTNTSTSKIPTISIKKGNDLSMKVSASDMVKQDHDVPYYAIQEEVQNNSQEKAYGIKWSSTPIKAPVATIDITGGEARDNYRCEYVITVTASNTMASSLSNDDITVYLYNDEDKFAELPASLGSAGVNLTAGDTGLKKTYNGTITLPGEDGHAVLKADVKINNDMNTDQTAALADKELVVDITTELSKCALVPYGEE